MKRKDKRLAISLAVVCSLAIGMLGVFNLQTLTQTASASAQTANVDVLGNFVWDEVAGATGYTVSYTIGSQAPVSFTTEDNQANVGIALTKAVQVGQTELTFSVTPTGGTATQYTYTIERYVDYGYATHDFADVKAQASAPTKISELSLDGSYAGWISSAMFKNDVLTMGMRADEAFSEALKFYLFGAYTTEEKGYNYRISQKMDGSVALSVNTGASTLTETEVVSAGTDYNTPLIVGENYYLQIAVFDTYDTTGAVVGETVYYTRNVYDETTDSLKAVGGFTKFNADTTGLLSYKYTPSSTVASSATSFMEVDRSGLYVSAGENNATTRVFSGIPEYEISAPTGVCYDNFDATMNWNKVEKATAYEYKIGENDWTEIKTRKVNVESEIEEYKTLGYLPFSVRAKGGKVAIYNLDLTRFYNKRSLVNDYNDVGSSGDNTNGNKFKKVTSLSSTYGPSSYTQINTKAVDYETGAEKDFSYGSHVTLKLKVVAEKKYLENTDYKDNYICKIGLFGAAKHDDKLKSYDRYFLTIYGDGTVQLGTSSIQPKNEAGRADRAKFWRVQNIADSFRKGYSYFITFGVDEVMEGSTVLAHRVTARIEERTGRGLDRKLLGIVTYDNERLTDEMDGETVTKKYTIAHTPTLYGDTKGTAVSTYKAMSNSNHTLTFKTLDKTLTTKQVDFGTYYDYSNASELQNFTVPTGYTHDGSWYYVNASGLKVPFPLTGNYGITTSNALTGGALDVYANLTPIEYDVTFDTASENSAKYTIESIVELKSPTTIPAGKVFDGWYEASDTSFQNKITSLQGKTGNLSLVAHFVDGYKITVNGEENGVVSGASFDLPSLPSVDNKTFVGWEVLNGTSWEEYTGEENFTPTADMQFRAVYDWTEYALTYEAQGATHMSASVYTKGETTTLGNATKAGYFFAGWYLDEQYTTLINDTADLVGNQTLYAKFVENTLKDKVELSRSYTAQELPAPKLPADASYFVKVEKGTESLAVLKNKCILSEAGTYTLTYTITLGTGKTYTHVTTCEVGGAYVVYIHYGQAKIEALMKQSGATLAENEIPETVEGYTFGGLYSDSEYTKAFDMATAITDDVHIYVKWIPVAESETQTDETPTPTPEPEKKDNTVLLAVIGAIAGVIVGGGVCIAIAVWKKKANAGKEE